jgi:hypothetical protein
MNSTYKYYGTAFVIFEFHSTNKLLFALKTLLVILSQLFNNIFQRQIIPDI